MHHIAMQMPHAVGKPFLKVGTMYLRLSVSKTPLLDTSFLKCLITQALI
jgi:hypothetical protein